ncbi:MAG: NAD-dependent epimerase/dehydratase family protein [bacterium]|nr:NAD-dependent epimerase/dehydratase family protein [bacterium]
MKNLLITGGSGLLGSALKPLSHDAIFVDSQNADLRDLSQVRALFQKFRPSHVIHLAAKVGGVRANAEQNADLFTHNVQINTNVLGVACEMGVTRLISILSSCAFNLYPDQDSSEDDLHVKVPFEGNLGYGYSKRMLDIHTKLLCNQYGCRFSTIAPVTMYGPHDNFDVENGHVISSLLHKSILAKKQEKPLQVWGGGQAIRQFIYVEDVAKLLLEMLTCYDGPETTIIASDDGVTIRELVDEIVKSIGYEGMVEFDKTKPEGVLVKRLKSNKFDQQYPNFSFTPLQKGLQKTVEWFHQNIDSRILGTVKGESQKIPEFANPQGK